MACAQTRPSLGVRGQFEVSARPAWTSTQVRHQYRVAAAGAGGQPAQVTVADLSRRADDHDIHRVEQGADRGQPPRPRCRDDGQPGQVDAVLGRRLGADRGQPDRGAPGPGGGRSTEQGQQQGHRVGHAHRASPAQSLRQHGLRRCQHRQVPARPVGPMPRPGGPDQPRRPCRNPARTHDLTRGERGVRASSTPPSKPSEFPSEPVSSKSSSAVGEIGFRRPGGRVGDGGHSSYSRTPVRPCQPGFSSWRPGGKTR